MHIGLPATAVGLDPLRSCAMATITWPTAITTRVQLSYGCQFNMLLISRSHEDENTDLIVFGLMLFLGDITRFFRDGMPFYKSVSIPWTQFLRQFKLASRLTVGHVSQG